MRAPAKGALAMVALSLGALSLGVPGGPAAVLADEPPAAPDSAGQAADTLAPGFDEPVERYFIRSTGDSGLLAQRYPHLAVWLEPDGAPRALALMEPEAASPARGAAVILADEGRTANDVLVETLRGHLTRSGWAAMSLGNDELSPALLLARQRLAMGPLDTDDAPAPADQPVMIDVNDQAAEDLVNAHQDEMNARLAAAVAWLQGRGYESVMLVGIGRGAAVISDYLPMAPEVVSRAAWIAPEFGGLGADALVSGLADTTVALLELYPSAAGAVDQRRAAFRRAGRAGYEAVPVAMRGSDPRHYGPAVASRLTGWANGD